MLSQWASQTKRNANYKDRPYLVSGLPKKEQDTSSKCFLLH